MTIERCDCGCHGGVNDVSTSDPIEAVIACVECQNIHCPALQDSPYPPPQQWSPEKDATGDAD